MTFYLEYLYKQTFLAHKPTKFVWLISLVHAQDLLHAILILTWKKFIPPLLGLFMSSNKVLKSNSMFKWLIWLFRRAKKTLQTRPSRATVSLRGGDRPQTQVSYTWQDPDLSVPKWQTTLNINKTSHIGIPYASVEPWTRKKEKTLIAMERSTIPGYWTIVNQFAGNAVIMFWFLTERH